MTEDQLEHETLAWLQDVGYTHIAGPDIAPDGPAPERSDYRQVLLAGRLKAALVPLHEALSAARHAARQEREALIAEAEALAGQATDRDTPSRV